MASASERRRIAIACQGGGSHTAFTAGVLKRLLGDEETRGRFDVVGLSGTSGGAICALLAWYGLADEDIASPGRLLDAFWRDNSATAPHERLLNSWIQWAGALQDVVAMPVVSPYDNPLAATASADLRRLITRHVDFDAPPLGPGHPMLLVGAADVLSGQFRAFDSRHDRISVETILASAAIPTLFRSVHVEGGVYWDGLFSQNPPVEELLDAAPDELWVIQINPTARAEEPRTVLDIADRRNELSGNLSLYQELHGIEVIDRLLAEGVLVGSRYKHITVRVLEFARPPSTRLLGSTSKLNRDARFLKELMTQGERQAEEFLATLGFESAWRAKDIEAVLGHLAPDVQLTAAGPFAGVDGDARARIAELCRTAAMDLTRKQLTRDRAVWDVRLPEGPAGSRGRIEAEIVDGKVVRLGFS